VKFSICIAHNDFVNFQRVIDLRLESGGTASIAFPASPPTDWLQFNQFLLLLRRQIHREPLIAKIDKLMQVDSSANMEIMGRAARPRRTGPLRMSLPKVGGPGSVK